MATDNVGFLAETIRTRRPLLLAGAGASAMVGYPLWTPFVQQLASDFAPQIQEFEELLAVVDLIADTARGNGHEDQYLKALYETFCPEKRTDDMRFHRNLVSLGFSGIVTTNFDVTLEHACNLHFRPQLENIPCDSIDLRDPDRRFSTFRFLRDLGTDDSRRHVLHLHGIYNAARRMVLGARSYEAAYGHRQPDENDALQTFHRRIVYTLLARGPVLFAGFSLTDPFFNALLSVLERDFVLTEEPAHFAILSYDFVPVEGATAQEVAAAHEAAQESVRKKLRGWIVPICYHAPGRDHSALTRLIEDVGAALDTVTPAVSAVEDLAARTIQEL